MHARKKRVAGLGEIWRPVGLVYRQVRYVFPLVDAELSRWRLAAETIPEPELRRQALVSLEVKRFHCLGGGVYALMAPERVPELVRAIVAIQTISDYLDNLCDRAGVYEEAAFRTLHEAMMAAVDPLRPVPPGGFYADYPLKDDGGYLVALAETSRKVLSTLPGYGVARPTAAGLAGLYSDLQVYKHLATTAEREARLAAWHRQHRGVAAEDGGTGAWASRALDGRGLEWWEFGAASGSTLGLFVLMAAAASGRLDAQSVDALLRLYFPTVCGLHIMLDYFIDQDEDEGRDLNFVSYYPDDGARVQSLLRLTRRSLELTRGCPDGWFHRTVIHGLLALYLSDPKVEASGLGPAVRRVLGEAGGAQARLMHRACCLLRSRGVIR